MQACNGMPQEQGVLFLMGQYSLNCPPLFPFLVTVCCLSQEKNFVRRESKHLRNNEMNSLIDKQKFLKDKITSKLIIKDILAI